MSLMIASDLHGSALFCRDLLSRFAAEGCAELLLLGDILYHGPRNDLPEGYAPKQVVALLNAMSEKILCVRGNCDAEVDEMVLSFPFAQDTLALEREGLHLLAAHGHHTGPQQPVPAGACSVFLFGHTHIPFRKKIGGVWYLNPGSISIPKEGSARGYVTLDASGFQWKTLQGETYDALPLEALQ